MGILIYSYRTLLFLFIITTGFSITSFAQQRIFFQDFENAVVGTDFLMSAVGVCTDETGDYIGVIDAVNGIQMDANGGPLDVTNIQGNKFFGAMDIGGTTCGTPAADDIDAMYIRNIDITGYTDLQLRIMIAEGDDGNSEDWDRDDFFHIKGRVDSQSEQNLIWVEMDSADAFDINGKPLIDTNFNGEGDGAEITNAFTTYTADISGVGDELDLTFFFHLNRADEDIAFDNIEVYGNPPAIIAGDEGWRLLSLPKSGGTIEDISDDVPVQGITGGLAPNSDPSFFTYDNSGSFEQPANTTTSWGDGYGFGLYFFDKDTLQSNELPDTLSYTGDSPTADVTVTLNSGAANLYTLVGNPFGSNFNTKSITSTGGSISDNISFWNDFSSSYSIKDRTATSATSGYIVTAWQGFWVETADATVTSLTMPYSGSTLSNEDRNFFKTTEQRGDISFTLSSENSFDEAIRLAFREHASLEFDRADATKLTPLTSTFATMAFNSNERLKSVESLPISLDQEITLALEHQLFGVEGEFTFEWNGLETIPANWGLTLHDYELGTSLDMREVSHYTFDEHPDSKSKREPLSILNGPNAVTMKNKGQPARFGLTIKPNATSVVNETKETLTTFSLEQNYPNPFNPSTTIAFELPESGSVTLEVFDVFGKKIATLLNNHSTSSGRHTVNFNASGLASGMYIYRLQAGSFVSTKTLTLIK